MESGLELLVAEYHPEGPSTQYFRTLVPKTIEGMIFGTRSLKYWVLGPSESVLYLRA